MSLIKAYKEARPYIQLATIAFVIGKGMSMLAVLVGIAFWFKPDVSMVFPTTLAIIAFIALKTSLVFGIIDYMKLEKKNSWKERMREAYGE